MSGEIQQSSIISKLSLLAISFPNLRYLWARSSVASAEIMLAISQDHDEPNVKRAVQVGGGEQSVDASAEAYCHENTSETDIRHNLQDMLLSLPGISIHNFRGVMNSVRDMAQLSTMSEAQLTPLIGPSNARKLRAFFVQSLLI